MTSVSLRRVNPTALIDGVHRMALHTCAHPVTHWMLVWRNESLQLNEREWCAKQLIVFCAMALRESLFELFKGMPIYDPATASMDKIPCGADRTSVVKGKSGIVRVDIGGRRRIKKQKGNNLNKVNKLPYNIYDINR